MIVAHVQPNITVPLAEATVLELVDADPTGRLVILENLDLANTMTYKWQTSPDRSVWTDLAASTTLAPLTAIGMMLTSANNFHRLRASGNLTAAVGILRHRSFSGALPLINY